jgi:hypothetical protein
MKTIIVLVLLGVSFFYNCKPKNSVQDIEIVQNPVFTEIDTSDFSLIKKNFSRHDFFLIRGDINNKEKLNKSLNEFVKRTINIHCEKYTNYIMFFYKETASINNNTILNTDLIYRYQLFENNRAESFIGSCYCSDFDHTNEIRYNVFK